MAYRTPNATKKGWLCRLDCSSFSWPCRDVWIETRSWERILVFPRTFEGSIPGTILRRFHDFVTLFPDCPQAIPRPFPPPIFDRLQLGYRVMCMMSGTREGAWRCPIVVTQTLRWSALESTEISVLMLSFERYSSSSWTRYYKDLEILHRAPSPHIYPHAHDLFFLLHICILQAIKIWRR